MQPVAGTSNGSNFGPTAIPKGQTDSSARVLVTGRVTAMVIHPPAPTSSNRDRAGRRLEDDRRRTQLATEVGSQISLAIGALAMDQSNPLVLYAGTGEGDCWPQHYAIGC